jgi:hypothetical protein
MVPIRIKMVEASDEQHCEIVADYFRLAGGWLEPVIERRSPLFQFGDPLFAVWAYRAADRRVAEGEQTTG